MRYKLYLSSVALFFCLLSKTGFSQSAAINTDGSLADASAMLDIKSTNKGLLIPRVASTAAVANPANGLLIYQTGGTPGFYYNAGTSAVPNWTAISSFAGTAAGGDLTGTYPNPSIANGAVTDAKVANGISYSKLTGAPTSLPPNGAAGGDLTSNYPNPTIANNAVTTAKILDLTILNADISASAAIAYGKLSLTNSIVGADIAAGTFTTTNSHRALANNDNVARELRFLEPSGSGSNYTAFKAQAQAADLTYTLPNAGPIAANQVLQIQSVAGNNATLSWGSVGGGSIIFFRRGVIANAGNTTYNIVSNDDIVGVDMSAGTNFTVNLQPATTAGEILIVKVEKYNNALLPVLTIQPNGTDKVEGANNLAFGNAGGIRRLYSDGAGNWYTW